jgi:hypothetical protein
MSSEHQENLTAIKLITSAIGSIASAVDNMSARLTAVENLSRNIQQTINMVAQRSLHGRRPVRCLFLVHNVESWDAYADIYDAMLKADDFKPSVATVNRWLAGPRGQYKDEHINHDELTRLNVPHIRLNMPNSYEGLDIIKALKPDIIFRQAPWEGTLPPGFAARELNFARLCYVPYGFMTVRRYVTAEIPDAADRNLQTDQTFHRLCWRIFCETEMHKEMFRKTAVRGADNVICSGYPKFDRLLQAKNRPPFWPIPAQDEKRRFRLIWAPHHSVESAWLNFATFPEMHQDMLAWARATTDFDIVLKPHPSLFDKLIDTQTMTQQSLNVFLDEWKSLPNTALVEGADYGPLFCGSDAMLTDGISFIFEYPLFEKPLIFLDNGRNVGFNEAGAVGVEAANTVKTFAEARALCEHLRLGEPDPKAGVRNKVLSLIHPYPNQSVRKILDSIREGLNQDENLEYQQINLRSP